MSMPILETSFINLNEVFF